MAKFNMDSLKNPKSDAASKGPQRATFKASNLTVTITNQDTGELVMEAVLTPRGFTCKEDKRSGKTQGGIGWYADIRGDDCGAYKDHNGDSLAVSAGLRVSVAGIKVGPDDVVDLTGEE